MRFSENETSRNIITLIIGILTIIFSCNCILGQYIKNELSINKNSVVYSYIGDTIDLYDEIDLEEIKNSEEKDISSDKDIKIDYLNRKQNNIELSYSKIIMNDIPLLYYKGYKVLLNGKKKLEVERGRNNLLEDFNGTITVKYKGFYINSM